PIEERLIEAERRIVAEQALGEILSEAQLELVVAMADGALVIVALRTQLLPAAAAAEIHAAIFGRIDVARPEQADVAVAEDVLRRPAAKAHVHVMRRGQGEARPAFEVKGRRRRLVQLRLGRRDAAKLHRRIARLEED